MTRTLITRTIARTLARTTALLFCLPLAGAFAQPNDNTNVVEERVTVENGAVKVCGEGDGLSPCLDANGQTYSQEVHGPGIDDESDSELAAEAARIRAENPEELNKTIGELEQGYNPDAHATEGLPD
jgi:hypothetical protein